ncbi:hypothetical protein D3C87_2067610 [compost metagenome]
MGLATLRKGLADSACHQVWCDCRFLDEFRQPEFPQLYCARRLFRLAASRKRHKQRPAAGSQHVADGIIARL